ncbi:MAG: hypothetical protein GF347_00675 [Candidatus Moranbacteria bacterium]|nr:hypothetical protein [Candidatus Moranbacteria bacterium]
MDKLLLNKKKFYSLGSKPVEIVMHALEQLDNERMRLILIKRFGLGNFEPQTLEAIGREFAITRERIRQIERDALKKLEKNKRENGIESMIIKLRRIFERYNGIVSERRVFSEFENKKRLDNLSKKTILLILRLATDFYFLGQPQKYEKAWYLKNSNLVIIDLLNKRLVKELGKIKKPLAKKNLLDLLRKDQGLFDSAFNSDIDVLYAYLDIPKKIQQNVFGKWGLIDWPEITPKKIKDKIHLVFKKHKRPMHYREVVEKIEQLNFDNKKVCIATVHNELIKDDRFVLIGRGVYAIKDWNYFPGTVRDVLVNILKNKKGRRTRKDELIEETLKQRQVEVSTIILNLSNSKVFKKKGNYYYLSQSTK